LATKENELLITLANAKEITAIEDKAIIPKGCIKDIVGNNIEIHLNFKENVNKEDEKIRLNKKIKEKEDLIEGVKEKNECKGL